MKTLKIFSLASVLLTLSFAAFAQKKVTETVHVNGNCGMCKTKIEKAAKDAGASKAEWDSESKTLKVTYSSSTTNLGKIQETVAGVGYDTRDFRATDEAYSKLHACCKYERAAVAADKANAHCQENCDMKDGKCTNMEACKAKGCCKDEADCKAKGCCKENKDHAAAGKDASCCAKDGAVAKEDAKKCEKDCCKKS